MSKKLCIFANHFMEQNDKPFIIAGPCSVESREQLLAVSKALCRMPRVRMIRGGVWKPRTRPGAFEGLGEPALRWMKEISDSPLRMADGQPVRFCCEVARPEHVALCQQYGIQTVWIGARTTANPFMVEEICEALRGSGMQVMVKNPVSPDLKLWIGAVERLQQAGIDRIMAIHRGFSMFNNLGYRNAPLWEVALEFRRHRPDIPILCDPSHIGGDRSLVAPLSLAAVQLDYDGLLVEVHPSPSAALSDAAQQLTPDELTSLLSSLPCSSGQDNNASLEPLRKQIDDIDHELLSLLSHRMNLSRQIASVKREQKLTVYQAKRWEEVMNDRLQQAESLGLNPEFIKELLEKIHGESVRVQMD